VSALPALVILASPPFALLVWYTHAHLGGSLTALATMAAERGVGATLAAALGPHLLGSRPAWLMLAVFAAVQLALLRLLPGARVRGSETPAGDVPEYTANGVPAFAVTLGLFALGAGPLGLYSPTVVYDHFGDLLGALNVFALLLCAGLYLKGRLASGRPAPGFFAGTELHPRVLGWDVKMFVTCRMGMLGWPVILLSFAAAQRARHDAVSDSMLVAVGLQLLYIAKFFWWEPGYLRSFDIAHDRAGFYICWGCLVWLPSVYTSGTLYLVDHPRTLAPLALPLFVAGVGAIALNYLADAQRQRVRAAAGATRVWGKAPALIRASWVTTRGERRESLLLASGWWGLARHFHYVPELLAAVLWTLPAGFEHPLPWLYVLFLTGLLIHRTYRQDAACARKYGNAWERYRRQVRWRMVPGIF